MSVWAFVSDCFACDGRSYFPSVIAPDRARLSAGVIDSPASENDHVGSRRAAALLAGLFSALSRRQKVSFASFFQTYPAKAAGTPDESAWYCAVFAARVGLAVSCPNCSSTQRARLWAHFRTG